MAECPSKSAPRPKVGEGVGVVSSPSDRLTAFRGPAPGRRRSSTEVSTTPTSSSSAKRQKKRAPSDGPRAAVGAGEASTPRASSVSRRAVQLSFLFAPAIACGVAFGTARGLVDADALAPPSFLTALLATPRVPIVALLLSLAALIFDDLTKHTTNRRLDKGYSGASSSSSSLGQPPVGQPPRVSFRFLLGALYLMQVAFFCANVPWALPRDSAGGSNGKEQLGPFWAGPPKAGELPQALPPAVPISFGVTELENQALRNRLDGAGLQYPRPNWTPPLKAEDLVAEGNDSHPHTLDEAKLSGDPLQLANVFSRAWGIVAGTPPTTGHANDSGAELRESPALNTIVVDPSTVVGAVGASVAVPVAPTEAHPPGAHQDVAPAIPISIKTVSIIMAAHNEHDYLQRTLESIFNTTSLNILKEVVIVDDLSDPPLTESYDHVMFPEPSVRVVRNNDREGLIRSKAIGVRNSSGDLLVFLDAHVRPDPDWLVPLLRHVSTNYRRVVVPTIPRLDPETWEPNRKAIGYKMMFEWNFAFHWFDDKTDEVPIMSGGLLAMSRKWWDETEGLDEGMHLWGAENIEQSLRTWLCGGEVVVARDSIIAHVFRTKFPYKVDSKVLVKNRVRAATAWFDEFGDNFFTSSAYIAKNKDLKDGSISDILRVKEKLQCKPFKWFVNRFRDVFEQRGLIPRSTFHFLDPVHKECLSATKGDQFNSKPINLEWKACDEESTDQMFSWAYNATSLYNIG
eukprot:GHVT01043021.1.p1 GENE.GHVT01043021.1~~GHVT01043021.1.p1  ORF type:complete len:740 (-),score=146.15 GHVT01043021.1:1270-3489(-)